MENRNACPSNDCRLYIKVTKLWVPYIIFRNTDSDEAVTVTGDTRTLVSVTKEGGFVRSGPEVADEVHMTHIIVFPYLLMFNSRLRYSRVMRTC